MTKIEEFVCENQKSSFRTIMKISKNCKVKLEYEGRLESGEIFDSSKHGDHSHPLEFVVGLGQVIKGFDDAVIGMEKNQEKEFKITPQEGYGEYNPQLLQEIPKETIPNSNKFKKEMTIILSDPEGNKMPVKIADVKENTIVLDLNHPLAGKNLIFKIKVIEISQLNKDKGGNANGKKI